VYTVDGLETDFVYKPKELERLCVHAQEELKVKLYTCTLEELKQRLRACNKLEELKRRFVEQLLKELH